MIKFIISSIFFLLLISSAEASKKPPTDNCGDINNGIDLANQLGKWTPAKPQGEVASWYYEATKRVQASLLQAKLDSHPKMDEETKAKLKTEIDTLCNRID